MRTTNQHAKILSVRQLSTDMGSYKIIVTASIQDLKEKCLTLTYLNLYDKLQVYIKQPINGQMKFDQ